MMETKEEKRKRILHVMKFFIYEKKSHQHAKEYKDLYPFHDASMYLPDEEKWILYAAVMKKLVRKNPAYLYVEDVLNATTVDQLTAFERDYARPYFHNPLEQKLLKNETYHYIEGILSYTLHRDHNNTREIMVFGEQHVASHCDTFGLKILGYETVPYVHVLHHILTTQATAKDPIDVFIEWDRTPTNLKVPQKTVSIDEIFLYSKTQYRYPLQQLGALYGRDVLPHVRFHWVDVRNFPFLNEMMHVTRYLKQTNGNEPDRFQRFLDTYIHPLIDDDDGQFIERLFIDTGIRKQLSKIPNGTLSRYIETYFKRLILSLAHELIDMNPVQFWKDLLRMKDIEKQRKLLLEIYEDELLPADRAFLLKTDQPVRFFRSEIIHSVHRLNAYFMDAYTVSRLFKPYVRRAVIHVGDIHADTYRNFLNKLPGMRMLEDHYDDTGCLYVPHPPHFR